MPMGVAALPSPNMLAQMLPLRALLKAGLSFVSGKRWYSTGLKKRARMSVKPVFSMSFPTPDQRQREPVMETHNVTPLPAPSATAAASALPFPKKREANREIPTKAVKIQLITIIITCKSLCKGTRAENNGQWRMDNGQWRMDNGEWTMKSRFMEQSL